ncbi:hypothetical protein HPB50_024485 [Hyalomma asiaticum]|uniref:Uncharacterized protein n=1 Tax=Hyalomma asiaticum TaxID=266040 RepID=A0ACB7SYK0_HYAAI|nr:hypothetical protein HPB50_024485 [Hyalomma asiaticum]
MVLEYALTTDAAEYVRYASLRSHMDFDLVRSTTAQLKRVLASRLSDLRWMDGGTRKSALARLRELKVRAPYTICEPRKHPSCNQIVTSYVQVRFFFDRYEGSNESAQARWPSALPSQALTTYQRFREARFRSQLSQGDDVSGAQQQCTYDVGYKVLFLRLSVVDVREPESPAWPAFQAARLSPRLARCLLHVLLQRVRWSAASRSRLDALRSRGCGDMFYLVYANSMCEDPDHQRKSHQHDGAHWERVNKALSNDATFQKAFKCHLQNNNSACSFWGTR